MTSQRPSFVSAPSAIGRAASPSRGQRSIGAVTNPATGQVTGQVALASVADAQAVIESARAAFPAWRDTSIAKRTTHPVRLPRTAERPQARTRGDHHR